MIEACGGAGFVMETDAQFRIDKDIRAWKFESDLPADAGIVSQIHNAKSASSQFAANLEAAEPPGRKLGGRRTAQRKVIWSGRRIVCGGLPDAPEELHATEVALQPRPHVPGDCAGAQG